MASVRVEVRGPASPDVAWGRYLCPERWSTWAPHLSSVSSSTPVLQRGTTGHVTALGIVPARFEVLSVDPEARSWSWAVRVGPVGLVLQHSLIAQAGGCAAPGTAAVITMTGPWPVLLAYRPLMRRALRRLVR